VEATAYTEVSIVAIANVTEREFDREVLKAKSPVLVAFRASWCVPSQQLEPSFKEVSANYGDQVKVVTVDVGSDLSKMQKNAICRRYNVTRVPVVMLVNDGQVKDVIGGFTSTDDIREMVDRQLRPVLDVSVYNFDVEVIESKVPVLVHFHAAWCAASLEIAPLVDSAAEQFRGRAKVARMEFGPDTAQLCARYGIRRVPTLAVFQDGEIKDQILGAMKGGTKTEARPTSCVGLTASDNIAQMLHQIVA
jgi:thioredoxin 1